MDDKHRLMAAICGSVPSLAKMHQYLSRERLNQAVPEEVRGQFNVARNMALYSYFFYALAPEVHLKTYSLIEHALRIRANSPKKMMLKALMKHALSQGWVSDRGFRHIARPSPSNEWCRSMIDVIPDLRNSKAHGSTMLVEDCLRHISTCADFINQLFPEDDAHSKLVRPSANLPAD